MSPVRQQSQRRGFVHETFRIRTNKQTIWQIRKNQNNCRVEVNWNYMTILILFTLGCGKRDDVDGDSRTSGQDGQAYCTTNMITSHLRKILVFSLKPFCKIQVLEPIQDQLWGWSHSFSQTAWPALSILYFSTFNLVFPRLSNLAFVSMLTLGRDEKCFQFGFPIRDSLTPCHVLRAALIWSAKSREGGGRLLSVDAQPRTYFTSHSALHQMDQCTRNVHHIDQWCAH